MTNFSRNPTTPARPTPDTPQREVQDRFIACWSEIASQWGVNRTIGRIHALLVVSDQPLDAAAITRRLQISHGNTSTSLRALLGWDIVRRVYTPGERKASFVAEKDPWTWFSMIVEERRRREVTPVVRALHEVHDQAVRAAAAAGPADRKALEETRQRVKDFVEFIDGFVALIDIFLTIGHGRTGTMLRMLMRAAPKSKRGRPGRAP